jgi:hypothetical protein
MTFLISRPHLWLVPALLMHVILLMKSDALWTTKIIVYTNYGLESHEILHAHQIVFQISVCVTAYGLSFLPEEYIFALMPKAIGMRPASEAEKSCLLLVINWLLWIVRAGALVGLYGGLFVFY